MRTPLYYTFGNHMHWVDMQWLWGYAVLPGSVDDMLRLCREAGVRGNVNFDAVGYEKMAAECPEALGALRQAIAAGTIEPVGCSYGQPYGLFHGGESNIRQLTYGVRATRRLLGVRPRAFWEEEFYFFPQLPQLLAQCGYTGACLFFQWTWHTPEVPREARSLILWEGIDGTRLPTLPRNELNVHQWPEDFDGLLEKVPGLGDSGAAGGRPPAIVQWLELMPSRDWMCRSELLLPRLKALAADPRFELLPRTVSQLIAELLNVPWPPSPTRQRGTAAPDAPGIPVRAYTMDDVWHGMTLGKNADRHPKESRRCESRILSAEALAATVSLLGRPYPRWDVYPTWELEESWRDLLAAQHHDNHECEGLCGDIGYTQLERAARLAGQAGGRAWTAMVHDRLGFKRDGNKVAYNPLGWAAPACSRTWAELCPREVVPEIPPFGYRIVPPSESTEPRAIEVIESENQILLRRDGLEVEIDRARGLITAIRHPAWPAGVLKPGFEFPRFRYRLDGRKRQLGLRSDGTPEASRAEVSRDEHGRFKGVTVWLAPSDAWHRHVSLVITLDPVIDAVAIVILDSWFSDFDPGLRGALTLGFAPAIDRPTLVADAPHSCGVIDPIGRFRRKYPEGDWMTSPQWFEDVEKPFTGFSFVDFLEDAAPGSRGLLVLTGGSQQWLRTRECANLVVDAFDPWDAHHSSGGSEPLSIRLVPHGRLTNTERVRLAHTFESAGTAVNWNFGDPENRPRTFGPLSVEGAPNVLAHAFFRESMKSGEHLPEWAGHRMFTESGGACDHPFVIRLVEWDGEPAEVTLKLAGPVALAAKTNLLGEVLTTPGLSEFASEGPASRGAGFSPSDTGWLTVEHNVTPPEWAGPKPIIIQGKPLTWSTVRFSMRPREIATIYADMVLGRKQWRDLDAKREVWATVHKQE